MKMKQSPQEETLNRQQNFLIGLMSVFAAILFLSATPVWAVPQDHDDPDPCEDCDAPEENCPCEDGAPDGSQVRHYTGTVIQDPTDFSIPAPGFSLDFRRFHTSREPSAINEDLGIGWRHPYNIRLKFESGDFEPLVILRPYPGGSNELRYYENGDGTFGCVTPGFTSTIAQDSATSNWIETFASGNKYLYNQSGWLIAQEDRNGNRLTIDRNAGGEINFMEDAVGRRLTFTYSGGRITKITDPINRTVEFGYDGNGNLVTAKDRGGFTMTYTYDADRRITSKTREGRTWTYSYINGRIETLTDPTGAIQHFIYDLANRTTFRVDANSETWTTIFNSFGQWEKTINPLGEQTKREFDARRRLTSIEDSVGARLSFFYNDTGQKIRTTFPNGDYLAFAYDQEGRISSFTNARGETVHFERDGSGNLIQRTNSNGEGMTWQYDSRGLLVMRQDSLGRQFQFNYSNEGYLIEVSDGDGILRQYAYDLIGRRTEIANTGRNPVTITYDNLDRITEISSASGNNNFAFDAWDKVSNTDPLGRTWQFEYDKRSELIEKIDPSGATVAYGRNASGRIASITDPNNRIVSYKYDALGRKTEIIYQSSQPRTEKFFHSITERTMEQLLPSGETGAYEFDVLGRVSRMSWSSGQSAVYKYDSAGRMVEMVDNIGMSTWSYDSAGRLLTHVDANGRSLAFSYDSAGRVIYFIDPEGIETEYEYDSRDNLIRVSQNGMSLLTLSYSPSNKVTSETYAGIGVKKLSYTDAGHPSTMILISLLSGDTILHMVYQHDSVGNRLSAVELVSGETWTWRYNSKDELVSESHADSQGNMIFHYDYHYDSVGNRLSAVDLFAGDTLLYSYGEYNELLAAGADTFVYDLNGNLIEQTVNGITTQYQWRSDGLLKTVSIGGDTNIEYSYDGLGRVIGRSVNNTIDERLWVFENIVAEYDSNGSVKRRYLPVGNHIDEFFMLQLSGETIVLVQDPRRDVVLLLNESGAVVGRYDYRAFGTFSATGSKSDLNNVNFQGLRMEISGAMSIYYARNRFMSPLLGRFISWDPLRQRGGINMYRFASNNPLTRSDPYGLTPTFECEGNDAMGQAVMDGWESMKDALTDNPDCLGNGGVKDCLDGVLQNDDNITIECGDADGYSLCEDNEASGYAVIGSNHVNVCENAVTSGQIEATLFHEILHATCNLDHADADEDENIKNCETACFPDQTAYPEACGPCE